MKKQILSGLMCLAILGSVYASGNDKTPDNSKAAASKEKAMKAFHNRYENIQNEMWSNLQDGLKVDFTTADNRNASAVFTTNGKWLYTITNYNADNLTIDLINLVKKDYDKYYIMYAKEVENRTGSTFFIVKLEGSDSYKTIKINHDGNEVLEDYKKNQ